MELQEAFDAGFEAVKAYVDTSFAAFENRLAAVEARAPERGEPGENGKDGELGPEGKPGRDGIDGKDGAAGLNGKDGAAGERGLPGEKGFDGKDGRDGQPGAPGAAGRDGLDGKDGAAGLNGKNGLDGLGFDDLSVTHDGERGFVVRFVRGDQVKEFPFTIPVVLDRGVWKEGEFKKGDGVTWGGSFFIAQCDTKAKPETSADWRLSIKRGRDGKDGKNGERGLQGIKGERGEVGPRGYGG